MVEMFTELWYNISKNESEYIRGTLMKFLKDTRKRKIFIALSSAALVLALIIGACAIYVGDYYRQDGDAISAFAPMSAQTPVVLDDGTVVFTCICI